MGPSGILDSRFYPRTGLDDDCARHLAVIAALVLVDARYSECVGARGSRVHVSGIEGCARWSTRVCCGIAVRPGHCIVPSDDESDGVRSVTPSVGGVDGNLYSGGSVGLPARCCIRT